ncbi:MAG: hypothetical protein EPO27_20690 [Betaproteobacteria bacterium]|nr:MAG: hypothetical protein EPO27_20690 [Betaproteobacteria bacterium]
MNVSRDVVLKILVQCALQRTLRGSVVDAAQFLPVHALGTSGRSGVAMQRPTVPGPMNPIFTCCAR